MWWYWEWSGHEGGALMDRIHPLTEETPGSSLAPSTLKATARRQPFMKQEAGPHQIPNPQTPWFWAFQLPELWEMFLLGFGLPWYPLVLSSFLFLPFGMVMSILYLFHHCILKAYNLFSVIGPQLERNVPQGDLHLDLTYIWFRWDFGLYSWCWNELRLLGLLRWN